MIKFWKQFDSSNSVIITPNNTLASYLIAQYNDYHIAHNNLSYGKTALIFSLDNFLQNLWDNFDKRDKILINDEQRILIWEQIVKNTGPEHSCTDIQSFTQTAIEAWDLTKKWLIETKEQNFASTNTCDIAFFQKWKHEYEFYCEKNGFIDKSTLLNSINIAIKHNHISIQQKTLVFASFDNTTLQLETMLSTLKNTGYCIKHIDYNNIQNSQTQYLNFDNIEQEILAMAKWAKSITEKETSCSIGCAVTNANHSQKKVERIFKDIFHCESINFDISFGKKLDSLPIIATALQLLEMGEDAQFHIETWLYIIKSPFLKGQGEEIIDRELCEIALRDLGKTHLTLRELVNNLHAELSLTDLLKQYLDNSLSAQNKYNIPSHFASFFTKQLDVLGWPGLDALEKSEQNAITCWNNTLKEFSDLDSVSKKLSYKEALHKLKSILSNRTFQDAKQNAKIKILTPIETYGINFDYLWVTGMDNENWPKASAPNPFIPISLQKKLGIPHSSSEQELDFAKNLIHKIEMSAKKIIYSYSKERDGKELQISPLISVTKEIKKEELLHDEYIKKPQTEKISKNSDLGIVAQEKAPQISESEKIRGGSRILELQSLCPFRAFAECRMNAQELKHIQFGFDKKERGTIIHNIMEIIWRKIKNQRALLSLSNQELETIVETSIETSLRNKTKNISFILENENFLAIEKQCLKTLVIRFLEYEKLRPSFFVVATEKYIASTIGRIQLRLRIDRIDRLQNGEIVIIDYKTGKTDYKITSWFDSRPSEIQLPLYCITSQEPISGLIFAKINSSAINMTGLCKEYYQINNAISFDDVKKQIKNAPNTWNELINNWQKTLAKLADDFHDGIADVNPKDTQKTCKICQLKSLCRIQ